MWKLIWLQTIAIKLIYNYEHTTKVEMPLNGMGEGEGIVGLKTLIAAFLFIKYKVSGADPHMVRIGTGPPFWQINHANSAYFRLFLGYFWVISATWPPLLDLGLPFLHILDPPLGIKLFSKKQCLHNYATNFVFNIWAAQGFNDIIVWLIQYRAK